MKIVLLLLVAMLAACGGGDPEPELVTTCQASADGELARLIAERRCSTDKPDGEN